MDTRVEGLRRYDTVNRTCVELKCAGNCARYPGRLAVNRTCVELKSKYNEQIIQIPKAVNRTCVELK